MAELGVSILQAFLLYAVDLVFVPVTELLLGILLPQPIF